MTKEELLKTLKFPLCKKDAMMLIDCVERMKLEHDKNMAFMREVAEECNALKNDAREERFRNYRPGCCDY